MKKYNNLSTTGLKAEMLPVIRELVKDARHATDQKMKQLVEIITIVVMIENPEDDGLGGNIFL